VAIAPSVAWSQTRAWFDSRVAITTRPLTAAPLKWHPPAADFTDKGIANSLCPLKGGHRLRRAVATFFSFTIDFKA
jgi:hypothetical protein